jgi:integrase
MIGAARKRGRNRAMDACAILLARIAIHGLRASERCQLCRAQIDLRHGRLHVNRTKGRVEKLSLLHGPEGAPPKIPLRPGL